MGQTPFEVDVANAIAGVIDLQSDEILRAKFKDAKHNIWKINDIYERSSTTLRKSKSPRYCFSNLPIS